MLVYPSFIWWIPVMLSCEEWNSTLLFFTDRLWRVWLVLWSVCPVCSVCLMYLSVYHCTNTSTLEINRVPLRSQYRSSIGQSAYSHQPAKLPWAAPSNVNALSAPRMTIVRTTTTTGFRTPDIRPRTNSNKISCKHILLQIYTFSPMSVNLLVLVGSSGG